MKEVKHIQSLHQLAQKNGKIKFLWDLNFFKKMTNLLLVDFTRQNQPRACVKN